MINKKSLEAVEAAKFSKEFCKPLYDSYCFSNIPSTIEGLFSGDSNSLLPSDVLGGKEPPFDHVVLLFLDAFGWTFFEKYKSSIPFLEKLEEQGTASKITSMFPSTTSAHVTCINTGLTPNQSGIYEWFMYEPILDEIIAPLPYSIAGDHKTESLKETILNPKELYPKETLYHRLHDLGVKSYAHQPSSIAHSTYSESILAGAHICPYTEAREAFKEMVSSMKGKTYHYFYFGEIDAIGHRKGIFAPEFSKSIKTIFSEIETLFENLPPNTAVILTADHGMVEVDPKRAYYINKKVPNIEKHLRFGKRNKPLVPAGSPRDLFLHVREESKKELKEVLDHFLEGIAEVFLVEELIEQQFFGQNPSTPNFLSRVGDIAILPYKGEAVWWYEKHHFQQNFYAAHGGLTKQEMETLFLFNTT